MRQEGIQGIRRDKTRKTTVGEGAETERPEDLVERRFEATAPNQLWVADLTYIRTHVGWVYAAFVIGVFSRQVMGWQTSTNMRTDLALDALDMGLWQRQRTGQDVTGLIHHSDRGVQYRAIRYTERLAEADAVASVGSKGDSRHATVGRLGVDPRRRDRRRGIRRLVQPPAPPRRDRARPTHRSRGHLLGIRADGRIRSRTRPRRGRNQLTEPPRNPGRFNLPPLETT